MSFALAVLVLSPGEGAGANSLQSLALPQASCMDIVCLLQCFVPLNLHAINCKRVLMPCTRRACKLQPKLTRSKLSLATPAAALFSQSVSGKVHMIGGCLEACRLECSLCTLMLQSLAAKLAV